MTCQNSKKNCKTANQSFYPIAEFRFTTFSERKIYFKSNRIGGNDSLQQQLQDFPRIAITVLLPWLVRL